MTELEKKICKLQDMITIITQLLMGGKTAEPLHLLPTLSQLFKAVIGDMMLFYQEKGIENYVQEIEYWRQQVGRITIAIESDDYFRLIDVLYFETQENLEEFRKLL